MPELGGSAAVVDFLEREGAGRAPHAGGRSLLDHLRETAAILERWGAPEFVVLAALVHSVYGRTSDAGAARPAVRPLLAASRRAEVAAVVGERAERLAWLFRVTSRRPLLAGTLLWARPAVDREEEAPSREELEALVLLHAANLADQVQSAGGGPGAWVARAGELAALLPDAPPALAACVRVTPAEEELALSAYRRGDGSGLSLCAAVLPVVGEPCLWLSWLARQDGRAHDAAAWAMLGGERLEALGVAWDKRLGFEAWLEIASALAAGIVPAAELAVGDGEALLAALRGDGGSGGAGRTMSGRERFRGYVESLTAADSLGREYPGLEGGPFFAPASFPLAEWFEAEFEDVRAEILGLEAASFQREAERIPRRGDWDVAFLWERGRRRDDVCGALPRITAALQRFGAMTTLTGLAYVSRMRPGTAIAPHRGPTNLRVRLHLGVVVPDGDCGLRVGGSVRRWDEGGTLVFDDYAEHEAWNRTGADRIVLIVDLWHPALTDLEVDLLKGLHGYAYGHAMRLERYWSANAAAAAAARRAGDD